MGHVQRSNERVFFHPTPRGVDSHLGVRSFFVTPPHMELPLMERFDTEPLRV